MRAAKQTVIPYQINRTRVIPTMNTVMSRPDFLSCDGNFLTIGSDNNSKKQADPLSIANISSRLHTDLTRQREEVPKLRLWCRMPPVTTCVLLATCQMITVIGLFVYVILRISNNGVASMERNKAIAVSVVALVFIISCFASFIYGLVSKKSSFLLPFIVFTTISLVATIGTVIVIIITVIGELTEQSSDVKRDAVDKYDLHMTTFRIAAILSVLCGLVSITCYIKIFIQMRRNRRIRDAALCKP